MFNLNPFKPKTIRVHGAERLYSKELNAPERDWSQYESPAWQRSGVVNRNTNVLTANEELDDTLEETFAQRKARVLAEGLSLRSYAVQTPKKSLQPQSVETTEIVPLVLTGELLQREHVEKHELETIAGWITGTVQYMGFHPYKYREKQNTCYVVTLSNRDVWGVELANVLKGAGVKIGDKIALKRTTKEPVIVVQNVHGDDGEVVGSKEIRAKKNHWIVRVISTEENNHESNS